MNHPHENPEYAANERDREEIRRWNANPRQVALHGRIALPKMVNRYLPHQGKREIARRARKSS